MERIMFGGIYRFNMKKFFIDIRGGIGVAFYGGVDPDYEDETVIITGIEVIQPSGAFASEFSALFGVHVSRWIDLSLALMLEVNGAQM
jgi:hypothetical protein